MDPASLGSMDGEKVAARAFSIFVDVPSGWPNGGLLHRHNCHWYQHRGVCSHTLPKLLTLCSGLVCPFERSMRLINVRINRTHEAV